MRNNPIRDLITIKAYIKFDEILLFVLKMFSGNKILNKILTSVKGHNSIANE